MGLSAREISVLLASAAVSQRPAQRDSWLEHAEVVGDWAPVLEAALRHGTLALVCWHLRDRPEGAIAPELSAAAQGFLEQQKANFEAALTQWASVLGELEQDGISTIPYKGPVSAWAYGDRPWMRSFRDLDFLVREPDFDRAIACLGRRGYAPAALPVADWQRRAIRGRARQDTLFAPGLLAVEPHCGFASRSLGLDLNVNGVFARSRVDNVFGRDVRVMSAEDTFLVLALHGCKECWRRLIWVVDVAEHLKNPKFDWEAAFSRARDCGLERCALVSLLLAHDLLGAQIPADFIRRARANSVCVALAARVRASLINQQPIESWSEVKRFHNALLERWGDRLRAWTETLQEVRQEDYAAVKLPQPTACLYVLVKAGRRLSAIMPGAEA